MGNLEHRLKRLEAQERSLRLEEAKRRFIEAFLSLSDEALAGLFIGLGQLEKSERERLAETPADAFAPEGFFEDRAIRNAWVCYLGSGAYGAERDFLAILKEFREREQKRLWEAGGKALLDALQDAERIIRVARQMKRLREEGVK